MAVCGDVTIPRLHMEIDTRVQFVTQYLALSESHMVDFFSCNHWDSLIHPSTQETLLKCTESELISVTPLMQSLDLMKTECRAVADKNYAVINLAQYLTDAWKCRIENSEFCSQDRLFEAHEEKTSESSAKCISDLIKTTEYMCTKKSHEVEEMATMVNAICYKQGVRHILDMGSGKGYLGTYLSLRYKLTVIGIDCSESNTANALLRSQKFMKYWNAHLKNKTEGKFCESDMKYTPVTAYIDPDNEIEYGFTEKDDVKKVVLTGLHACGDLSATALRTFVSKPEIQAACVVGCCYHQLTSNGQATTDQGFPMSSYLLQKNFTMQRNTRMLGLKALDRIENMDVKSKEEKSTGSLFYRAVLSVILQKEFGMDSSSKDLRVGKVYSKSNDFVDYVKRSMRKLKLPEEKVNSLTDDSILAYWHAMQPHKKNLIAFNMLREVFGPAVEALILLDRLLYLKEQQGSSACMSSHLVRLFDPVKSPRCYAIIGVKNDDRDAKQ